MSPVPVIMLMPWYYMTGTCLGWWWYYTLLVVGLAAACMSGVGLVIIFHP